MHRSYRILIIDDTPSIHEDFRKILGPSSMDRQSFAASEAILFGDDAPARSSTSQRQFEIDSALDGAEGLEKVRQAAREGTPYAMAYIDQRMPDGWSGIETINRIWKEFASLQIIICSAFSDHSWVELQEQLGESDRLFVLKKPFDHLEVRQLTFSLAERARMEVELRKACGEADRANRSKSQFLTRVSHELRTPLNAVLGFAQLLGMEETLGEEAQEHVGEILRGGRHLLGLINEVLDISRIEAGEMSLSIEPVCAFELVRDAMAMVSPLAATRNVRLETEPLEDRGWRVMADAGRLRQVMLNLLSNAIKYNRQDGEVMVRSALRTNADSQRLRIEVKDTGPGISQDKMARLFTFFDRLGAETTHANVEGAGLGLALSKRMAELMGGALGAESIEGEGATFWVELPIDLPPQPAL